MAQRNRPLTSPVEEPQEILPVPEPAGIPYALIGDQGKAQILVERARQLEAEHYNHSMNVLLAEGAANYQAVTQAKQAMVAIESALEVVMGELKRIADENA